MRYLLTEEEYQDLVQMGKTAKLAVEQKVMMLCQQVCDLKPIVWGWGDKPDEPKPWGCIRSTESEWYCDQCPVQGVCPYKSKHFSK